MAKHIILTEDKIKEVLAQAEKQLRETKMAEGNLKITCTSPDIDEAANIVFSPTAYAKMLALVMNFTDEVAWHGTVMRDGNDFYITDILVYPQEVTGVTVNTDQAEYEMWLMSLVDEEFNHLRFQGHSHVNMGVSPSTTDLNHQEEILEQLKDDDYYIFMIVNKKLEMFISIFDYANNIKFETEDVDVYIGSTGFNAEAFVKDAESLVVKRTYSYGGRTNQTAKTAASVAASKTQAYGNYYSDSDDWYGNWRGGYSDYYSDEYLIGKSEKKANAKKGKKK